MSTLGIRSTNASARAAPALAQMAGTARNTAMCVSARHGPNPLGKPQSSRRRTHPGARPDAADRSARTRESPRGVLGPPRIAGPAPPRWGRNRSHRRSRGDVACSSCGTAGERRQAMGQSTIGRHAPGRTSARRETGTDRAGRRRGRRRGSLGCVRGWKAVVDYFRCGSVGQLGRELLHLRFERVPAQPTDLPQHRDAPPVPIAPPHAQRANQRGQRSDANGREQRPISVASGRIVAETSISAREDHCATHSALGIPYARSIAIAMRRLGPRTPHSNRRAVSIDVSRFAATTRSGSPRATTRARRRTCAGCFGPFPCVVTATVFPITALYH